MVNQNMTANKLTQARRATPAYVPEVFQFEVVRRNSVWVFDDEAKGVQNEPFVCGLNEIIDGICQRFNIPPVDGQRIRATFCDARAIGDTDADTLVRENKVAKLQYDAPHRNTCPPNYTPYRDPISGLEGAFCPVFKLYFPDGNATTPKALLLLPEKVGL